MHIFIQYGLQPTTSRIPERNLPVCATWRLMPQQWNNLGKVEQPSQSVRNAPSSIPDSMICEKLVSITTR